VPPDEVPVAGCDPHEAKMDPTPASNTATSRTATTALTKDIFFNALPSAFLR